MLLVWRSDHPILTIKGVVRGGFSVVRSWSPQFDLILSREARLEKRRYESSVEQLVKRTVLDLAAF